MTVFLRPEHDVGLFADRTRIGTLHIAETVHSRSFANPR